MHIGLGLGLTRRGGGASFSPFSLFASGEAGAWYDPSDLSTLYQDSVGTTPVTAAGQPVGLVLDKSQGLVLGPEIAVDGGFDAGVSHYTAVNSIITDVGGSLRVAGNNLADPSAHQTSPSIVSDGAWVIFEFDLVEKNTTRPLYLRIFSGTSGADAVGGLAGVGAVGHYRYILKMPSGKTTAYPRFQISGNPVSSDDSIRIDNISVRELPGNHLTQATAAARPVYQTSPDRLDHDGVDDVMNVTLPDLGTDATVASVAGGTVTYLEAQTISGSYAAPTSDWAGLVIIDRALTADEKAALEGIWT